jgi:hypothetical protein
MDEYIQDDAPEESYAQPTNKGYRRRNYRNAGRKTEKQARWRKRHRLHYNDYMKRFMRLVRQRQAEAERKA